MIISEVKISFIHMLQNYTIVSLYRAKYVK